MLSATLKVRISWYGTGNIKRATSGSGIKFGGWLNFLKEMIELRKEFYGRGEVKGFRFVQLFKKSTGFFYKVFPLDAAPHYEVFERRINERYNTVTYPKSGSFGNYAWSYLEFEDAMIKYNQL